MEPQARVSESTINTLESLLEEARQGTLLGVAFIGLPRGRQPIWGWAGRASQDPCLALGAVRLLDDEMVRYAKAKGK
jgi:hypothetical protein